MNVIRTNIRIDNDKLLQEYTENILPHHNERVIEVSATGSEDTEYYYKYCFPGGKIHGMRFHNTESLSLEEERVISNKDGAVEYDHLFTKRNEKCVGYINDVLDFLKDAWRGTWWTMEPGFCYRPHTDKPLTSFRAHIVLTTNPYCYMAYHHLECHHLKADGYLYLAKTDIKHTAWNMGETPRTHVMMKMPLSAWDYYANHKEYRI